MLKLARGTKDHMNTGILQKFMMSSAPPTMLSPSSEPGSSSSSHSDPGLFVVLTVQGLEEEPVEFQGVGHCATCPTSHYTSDNIPKNDQSRHVQTCFVQVRQRRRVKAKSAFSKRSSCTA